MSRPLQVAISIWSIAVLVAMVVAIPVFVVKIPSDYFVRPAPKHSFAARGMRMLAGLALIVLGVFMLVLPGQGVLTILVGLGVLRLPVARRMMRRLLGVPRIREATNHMRARHGRPPLIVPGEEASLA